MSSPSPAQDLPRLGKYELLEEIGHGGMATVYRARDARLAREVAVKVVHKHLRGSPEVATRFAAEARAVAKLRHPNIVEVYDVADDGDVERFIVAELVRGTTLRKVLEKAGALPAEVAAAIGLELSAALSHAHAAGIVHRDVKPENVMIEPPRELRPTEVAPQMPGESPESNASLGDSEATRERRAVGVKLTDFGIAKILDAQGVTSTGQVLGSPAHMAPEQIEGAEVDARADVFGLGVLLYECMVGHLPFEGKNPAQVLRRVLEGSFVPADRDKPQVGGRWAAIVARALARNASGRYASVDAMAAEMRGELAAVGVVDPAAELSAFLRDPDGYRPEHARKLIPLLTARGEQARKKGDVVGAAADFNRALAYAPHDAGLLRQIARLSARRSRMRATKVAVPVVVGVGVVAGGVALWLRAPSRRPPAPDTAPQSGRSDQVSAAAPPAEKGPPQAPRVEAVPPPRSSATSLAMPSAGAGAQPNVERAPAARTARPAPSSAPARPATRDVSLLVRPPGALVSVDGGPGESWFQQVRPLSPGPHSFRAYVPNSRCCDDARKTEEIHPDDGSGPQVVTLSLRFRPAQLTVHGAPAEARLICPLLRVEGLASQVYQVTMGELEMTAACDLEAPGLPSRSTWTTLRAGDLVAVPWTNP